MRKIGLFGSSFNPLHVGHLIMSEQAIERLGLDQVLLIPTKNPYHKKVEMLDYEFRYKMAEIEAKKNARLSLSDVERNLESNSYTYDVIGLLREKYEDANFYFIMGSDSLIGFDKWYKKDDLMTLCSFVVFQRPEDDDVTELVKSYKAKGMDLYYFNDLQIEVSSTYIRNCIRYKKSVRYLLTDDIINFIEENKLYEEI